MNQSGEKIPKDGMKRFVTVEHYNGDILVFTEEDDYAAAINDGDTAEWIWQFASNKEEAIRHHYKKHDEWSDDMNAGRPEKRTY